MSREVTVTTPPSRSPRAWNGEGEVLGVVPLLGAQGRKEEAKVSLVETFLSCRSAGVGCKERYHSFPSLLFLH